MINLSVLVIDDNRLIANGIVQMLSFLGYQASAVFGTMQAYQALSAKVPNVILTDIHMQGIDGVGFCRSLRQNEQYAGLIIIAMSSDNQPALVESVKQAGADGFLPKPIEIDELEKFMKRVEQVLNKRHSAAAPA
jgi:CheY-like chemotaxis protein